MGARSTKGRESEIEIIVVEIIIMRFREASTEEIKPRAGHCGQEEARLYIGLWEYIDCHRLRVG